MKNKELKIGIIGAGGIGALFGSIMQKKGYKVFFLKKSKQDKSKINYRIKSNYYGNFENLLFFDDKKFYNSDVFILVTKYPHLKSLKTKLKKIKKYNKPFICLLNGLSHIDILNKIFKKNLILGSAGHIVSYKRKRYEIVHPSITSPEITLSYKNKKFLQKSFLKEIFKKSKMNIKVSLDNKEVIWEKLIRLNSLASLTSLYQCNLGKIRQSRDKYNDFIELTKEAIKVAHKDGYKTNLNSVLKKVDKLPDNLQTSMQRDLRMLRVSEIDTITGGVLSLGKKYDIKLPYHKKILKRIRLKYEK